MFELVVCLAVGCVKFRCIFWLLQLVQFLWLFDLRVYALDTCKVFCVVFVAGMF